MLPVAAAWAHEGDDALAEWYRSLRTPEGGSCCDVRDCAPADARVVGGSWEVIDRRSAWLPVPPDRVLRRENRDGRPIACIVGGTVVCFVPPPGTLWR